MRFTTYVPHIDADVTAEMHIEPADPSVGIPYEDAYVESIELNGTSFGPDEIEEDVLEYVESEFLDCLKSGYYDDDEPPEPDHDWLASEAEANWSSRVF